MGRYRILVADPNPAVRKLLSVIFDPGRYELIFASDGEEALGRCLVDPPMLVIAELWLDRLDGVALCERLKGLPKTAGAKVVLLTTSTGEWDVRRARRAGVDEYFTKPFSPAQLLKQVDRLLNRAARPRTELSPRSLDGGSNR